MEKLLGVIVKIDERDADGRKQQCTELSWWGEPGSTVLPGVYGKPGEFVRVTTETISREEACSGDFINAGRGVPVTAGENKS